MHSHTEGEGSRTRPFEGRVSTDIIWNSSTHKSSMALWVFILFYLDYNPIRLYFVSQIVTVFTTGSSSSAPVSLWYSPMVGGLLVFCLFYSPSFFSGTTRCHALLVYFCSCHTISPFSKEPWFLSWVNSETKPWVLGPFVSTGVLFLSGLFSCRERKYMCVH